MASSAADYLTEIAETIVDASTDEGRFLLRVAKVIRESGGAIDAAIHQVRLDEVNARFGATT